jgi:hypothetical protein
LSAIFLITLFNITSPKDQKVSQVENRALAEMPSLSSSSLFSGKYFREYESFFADHFFKRDILVQANKNLSSLKGIKRDEEVFLVDFNGQNVGGESNAENDAPPSTNGNLLILNDKVMEIFKFNETSSKAYAEAINTVSEKIGKDVKVYSLIAPIQIEFLNNKKYKDLSDSQYDAINYINSTYRNDIITVDAYNALQKHIDEYIYFRTDHHWTALGSYYAYTMFAKAAGFEALTLNEYKTGKAPGFLGHISTVNTSKTVNNNPDDVIYYYPPVKSKMEVLFYDQNTGEKKSYEGSVINETYKNTDQKYGIFIGGDFPLGKIVSNADSNKKIMVIKDSYGNAFIPFLVAHYKEIYVVDPRHYKGNIIKLAKDNDIHEILFVNYILTTCYESFMDSVLKLTE